MSFISLYARMVWPVKLIKTHVQHLLTATAMNMERLFSWYKGSPNMDGGVTLSGEGVCS